MKTILSNSKGDKHYFLIRFRGTNHPGFQVSFMPRTLPRVSDRRTKTDCGIRTRNLGRFSTTCAQRETLQQKPDRNKSINFPPPSYFFYAKRSDLIPGKGAYPRNPLQRHPTTIGKFSHRRRRRSVEIASIHRHRRLIECKR